MRLSVCYQQVVGWPKPPLIVEVEQDFGRARICSVPFEQLESKRLSSNVLSDVFDSLALLIHYVVNLNIRSVDAKRIVEIGKRFFKQHTRRHNMSKKKSFPAVEAAARDGHAAVSSASNPFKKGKKGAKVEDLEEEDEDEDEDEEEAPKSKGKTRLSKAQKSTYDEDVAKVAAFKAKGKGKPAAAKAAPKGKPAAKAKAASKGKPADETERAGRRALEDKLRIKVLPAAKEASFRGNRGERFDIIRKCKTVGDAYAEGLATLDIRFYVEKEVIELY